MYVIAMLVFKVVNIHRIDSVKSINVNGHNIRY
jgi:hypothetical protein